jgi:hypothetical protein
VNRGLIISSFAAVILVALSVPFIMPVTDETFVGGHYHLAPGESIQEDVRFYFTQVTIDEGATVHGKLFLYSSTLDLGGYVTEDIHAFESDLTLHDTAYVGGKVDQNDLIHWTLLLPAIAQIP